METSVKITIIITATVLILAAAAGLVYWQFNETGNTISVNGEATIKAMPDLIIVYFNIETRGNTAQEAKDNNSEIVDKVITNLVKIGLERKDIVTENFNVYPDYSWENGEQKFLGYRAMHSIKVELPSSKMDKVGGVIDAGVDGGAMIGYINFELSQNKTNEYKAQALKQASEDAKTKAESMASGLGKKIVDIESISESNFYYTPWRVYDNTGGSLSSVEAKSATTNIQPGEKDINAGVSVVFKIK